MIRPACYLAFLSVLCIEVWLLLFACSSTRTTYLIPATVLLSALLATCGWLWSGHVNRRVARRSQAITLLLAIRGTEVEKRKTEIYDYIQQRDAGESVTFPAEAVQKVLGFYEFLAVSVMSGAADEQLMLETQGFVFLRLHSGLRTYIEERQEDYAPLYCHFVHYAKKWNDGRSSFKPYYVKEDKEFF